MEPIVQEAPLVEVAERTELSIRVRSNELLDLPRVRKMLTEEQRSLLDRYRRTPIAYEPHLVTAEAREARGYRYDDEWIFEPRPAEVEVVASGEVAGELWAISPRKRPNGHIVTWQWVKSQLPAELSEAAELSDWLLVDEDHESWVFRVAS
jgi:hypothetical protein